MWIPAPLKILSHVWVDFTMFFNNHLFRDMVFSRNHPCLNIFSFFIIETHISGKILKHECWLMSSLSPGLCLSLQWRSVYINVLCLLLYGWGSQEEPSSMGKECTFSSHRWQTQLAVHRWPENGKPAALPLGGAGWPSFEPWGPLIRVRTLCALYPALPTLLENCVPGCCLLLTTRQGRDRWLPQHIPRHLSSSSMMLPKLSKPLIYLLLYGHF